MELMRYGNSFVNREASHRREPAYIIHKPGTLNGVGGRVGGGICESGKEEAGGRTQAQRPFALQPGLSVSCGERNVTGAAPGPGSGPGAGPCSSEPSLVIFSAWVEKKET